jgi:hypothetical protein
LFRARPFLRGIAACDDGNGARCRTSKETTDMNKIALKAMAASMLLLIPMTAHAAPVASGEKPIVLADRGGGKGGGGGGGPSMRGGGGGGGPAMRGGGNGQRSFQGGGRRGGDSGRAFRQGGNRDGGRAFRGNRGGGDIDRGSRRAGSKFRNSDGPRKYGYRGGKKHNHSHIRRHGHRYLWGPGLAYWYYDGYYYGDCDWLERRALATGSAYWWNRYERCVDWN